MLTVDKWRTFAWRFISGVFLQTSIIVIVSLILAPGLSYMGQSATPLLSTTIKSQVSLVLKVLLSVGFAALAVGGCLQLCVFVLSRFWRVMFALGACLGIVVRQMSLYPATLERVWLFQTKPFEQLLVWFASAPQKSLLRYLSEWSFYWLCFLFVAVNFYKIVQALLAQNEILRARSRSFDIEQIERESRRLSQHAASVVIGVLGLLVAAVYMSPSFKINLVESRTPANRSNVFLFAVDSLRTDRVLGPQKHVMPFLANRSAEADLATPMVVGVPRTFPSWVEIATCHYSLRNNVRTMFPTRSVRQNAEGKQTLFSEAKAHGFSTLFVSDFAGDIFGRYPFGATEVMAPTANLQTLMEVSILQNLSVLQSFLTLPRLHRIMPSLLENPSLADPRLLALAFAQALNRYNSSDAPLFVTTFFSQAHFPYAAPGPFFAKFQASFPRPLFKKESDQSPERGTVLNVDEKTRQATRALYDGSLNLIDEVLENLFVELKQKGWLDNAIVSVFGDHGENLYEANLGMGHGDDVVGEHATTTPLLMWNTGRLNESIVRETSNTRVVRTVDIAPTIARQLNFPLNFSECDGVPLLSPVDTPPKFPTFAAYQETGEWFVSSQKTPAGWTRVDYPGVTQLLDIDSGYRNEFFIRPTLLPSVLNAKSRAWITDRFRLVVHAMPHGAFVTLYNREADPAAEFDLLHPANGEPDLETRTVSLELLRQLNDYLQSQGVELLSNGQGQFFYFEHALK